MKSFKSKELRNISLLAHASAGKTSLAEAMLFATGAVNRLGKVEDGTTVADFDEEELERRISLGTALIPCEWKGHKLNVMDTPGYADFIGEVRQAVRVSDGVVIVVDSVAGAEVGTEVVWAMVEQAGLPRLVVINKMNRDNANELQDQVDAYRTKLVEAAAEADDELIEKYLEEEELTNEEIKAGLKAGIHAGAIVPVFCTAATASLGIQPFMDAIIDYIPSPLDTGPVVAHNPVTGQEESLQPNEAEPLTALVFKTMADPYVGKLSYFRVYSGALSSDSRVLNERINEEERVGQILVMRGKEQLPVDRLAPGDIGAVAKLSNTLTGDTLCDQGHPLQLPGIEFPNPLYAVAVSPKTQADSAKLNTVLTRIVEEDPSMRWYNEHTTRQTILAGRGDAHIDIAVRRMARKFSTEVLISEPKVPYKETITRVNSARYRHKKQTGGAGQFAEVEMRLEPLPRNSGFEYEWEVFGGAISRSFQPSIEKGIKNVLQQGVIAG